MEIKKLMWAINFVSNQKKEIRSALIGYRYFSFLLCLGGIAFCLYAIVANHAKGFVWAVLIALLVFIWKSLRSLYRRAKILDAIFRMKQQKHEYAITKKNRLDEMNKTGFENLELTQQIEYLEITTSLFGLEQAVPFAKLLFEQDLLEPYANLILAEYNNKNKHYERAIKHYELAASLDLFYAPQAILSAYNICLQLGHKNSAKKFLQDLSISIDDLENTHIDCF